MNEAYAITMIKECNALAKIVKLLPPMGEEEVAKIKDIAMKNAETHACTYLTVLYSMARMAEKGCDLKDILENPYAGMYL